MEMNRGYECEYCSNQLDDTNDVIFIDRSFLPSGAVFCNVECLMHFFNTYKGALKDIKLLIDVDEEYLPTFPQNFCGGNRTEACETVRRLAVKNPKIDQY